MAIYKIKIHFAVLWFNLNSFEEKTLQESRYHNVKHIWMYEMVESLLIAF